MKTGDILLAKQRAKDLFFNLLVIEIEYMINWYCMLGEITLYHKN